MEVKLPGAMPTPRASGPRGDRERERPRRARESRSSRSRECQGHAPVGICQRASPIRVAESNDSGQMQGTLDSNVPQSLQLAITDQVF
jgi:hypothetical protein